MDNQQLYASVVTILVIDGGTDVQELRFLQQLRQELDIPSDVARKILIDARKGQKRIHLPTEEDERRQVLEYLVQAALANDSIDPQEQKALEAVTRKLQLSPDELDDMIKKQTSKKRADRAQQERERTKRQTQQRQAARQRQEEDEEEDEDEKLVREVEEHQQKMRTVIFISALISFFCVALPYLTFAYFIPLYKTWNALQNTEIVPATLQSVHFYSKRTRERNTTTGTNRRRWLISYHLDVTYSYKYDGQQYHSDKVILDSNFMTDGYKKEMYAALKPAYEQGTPVSCYVSVTNPEIAVLDRNVNVLYAAFMILGIAAIITGIGTILILMLISLFRKSRS